MEHLGMYDLKGMSTDRLVELITDKRVSVLEAFGKKRLYRTLLPIRWLVKFALWIIFRKAKTSADARKRAVELLDKFTPYQVHGISLKTSQTNQPPTIIGFNHPSLGEIARLISLCFRIFPERPLIFPVTLPWFEMFAPFKHRFDGLGMTITPIITPHATETLLKGFAL